MSAEKTIAAVYFIPLQPKAGSWFMQQRTESCKTPVKLNSAGKWMTSQGKEFRKREYYSVREFLGIIHDPAV